MKSLFWLIGGFIVCSIGFTALEAVVFFAFHNRVRLIAGEWSDVIVPVDPVSVRFPVGIAALNAEISKQGLPALEKAHAVLSSHLTLTGFLVGLLSVISLYGLLVLASPASTAAYWSLLFLPLNGFVKTGARGVAIDKRLFGETYAFLNQLFLGTFTSVSFLTAIAIQGLRLFNLIP